MKLTNYSKSHTFRTIAFLLAVALATPLGELRAYAQFAYAPNPVPVRSLSLDNFNVPVELGTVREIHQGKNAELIIHLQDAHGNLSAQESLGALVKFFHETYGISLLLLEGGENELSMNEARTFPYPAIREKVARKFLRAFELTGPEYYVISENPLLSVFGIENMKSYYENRSWYFRARQLSRRLSPNMNRLQTLIRNMENKTYNAELKSTLRMRERARTQTGLSSEYLSKLKETLLAKKSWQETEFQALFPRLTGLLSSAPENLPLPDRDSFMNELQQLESEAESLLFTSDQERRVYNLSKTTEQIRKLIALTLTPREYTDLKNDFSNDITPHFKEQFNEIFLSLGPFRKFYDGAVKRDREMAEHTLNALKGSDSKSAILVSGGFHSPGLTQQLREKGCSYVVIQPKIKQVDRKELEQYHQTAEENLERLISSSQIVELEPIAGFGSGERYQKLLHALSLEYQRELKRGRIAGFGKKTEAEVKKPAVPKNKWRRLGLGQEETVIGILIVAIIALIFLLIMIRHPKKTPTAVTSEQPIVIVSEEKSGGEINKAEFGPPAPPAVSTEAEQASTADPQREAEIDKQINILESKTSPENKVAAMKALVELGGQKSAEALGKWLEHGSLSWRAATELVKIDHPRVDEILTEALLRKEGWFRSHHDGRRTALWALSERGGETAENALIDFLGIKSSSSRSDKIKAEEIESGDMLEHLLLLEDEATLKDAAFTVLKKIGDAVRLVDRIRTSQEIKQQEALIELLGQMAKPELFEPLVELYLEEGSSEYRSNLQPVIMDLIPQTLDTDSLLKTLSFNTPEIRALTANRLGEMANPGTAQPLIDALKVEKYRKPHDAIVSALERTRDQMAEGENDELRQQISSNLQDYQKSWFGKLYLRRASYLMWPVTVVGGIISGLVSLVILWNLTGIMIGGPLAKLFKSLKLARLGKWMIIPPDGEEYEKKTIKVWRKYIRTVGRIGGKKGLSELRDLLTEIPKEEMAIENKQSLVQEILQSLVVNTSKQTQKQGEVLDLLIGSLSAKHRLKLENVMPLLDAISQIKQRNPALFTEERLKTLLTEGGDFSASLDLLVRFAGVIPPTLLESRALGELARQIDTEISQRPPAEQTSYRLNLTSAIDLYRKDFVKANNAAAEYEEITSLLRVVHDNLPLVLGSLRSIEKSALKFKELRRILPLNNAFTRILRMLGESKSTVGGYADVTEKITKANRFDTFLAIVTELAKEAKAAAPQEIQGVLEILRHSKFDSWKDGHWEDLRQNIEAYYEAGFKTITYSLYSYFAEHKNDQVAVASMQEDMSEALGNVAWGEFNGFSDEFKKKYGLTTEDELGLLRRYMSAYNFTARDYAPKYEAIKKAIAKRGEDWRLEVDAALRIPYRMGSSKIIKAYDPSPNDKFDRDNLHKRLIFYGEDPVVGGVKITDAKDAATKTLAAYIRNPGERPLREMLKSALVSLTIQNAQLDLGYYTKVPEDIENNPEDDENILRWISDWYVLFSDAYRHDAAAVEEIVRAIVQEISAKELEPLLSRHRIQMMQRISIRKNDRLYKEEDEMMDILAETQTSAPEKKEKLADVLHRKWLNRIATDDLTDIKIFSDWVDRGIERTSHRLLNDTRAKEPAFSLTDEQVKDILRDALMIARNKTVRFRTEDEAKPENEFARKREKLADKIVKDLKSIFDDDIEEIEKERRGFKTTEYGTGSNLYVGFFDDLLHLMGFMMTCVCTWNERDKQVEKEGVHFGKMAIKNSEGRILGLSQVQLLRAGIKGEPHKASPQGWRVIALPGINLDRDDIGLTTEKAILVLLEAAQKKAEVLGMEGAVLPVSEGIHSNDHHQEKAAIRALVKKGWLRKATLTETVTLSSGYSYSEVYIVQIPKENFVLQETTIAERVTAQKKHAEQIAQDKRLIFGEGVGEIVYSRGIRNAVATGLLAEVDTIIKSFPKALMESIDLSASARDVDFQIRIMPELEKSYIDRANGTFTLYVGRDILYNGDKVEIVTLSEMLAEFFTAFILDDYFDLKEKAKSDENAYFKIENIKALINHENYLLHYYKVLNRFNWNPSTYWSELTHQKRTGLKRKYQNDLGTFTQSMTSLSQWNIFLNVLDDADPDFLVTNYIHLLKRGGGDLERIIPDLIGRLLGANVRSQISLVALRNIVKEFVLTGTAHIRFGEQATAKQNFAFFDTTTALSQRKEQILLAQAEGPFYQTLRSILGSTLPFSEAELNAEMTRLLENRLLGRENREEVIRGIVQELLVRKLGGRAATSLREHLTAQRGTKNIPFFQLSKHDLPEGSDADEFGYLEYATADDINYDLVFEGMEEHAEADRKPTDLIHELFPLPAIQAEGEQPAGFGFVQTERDTVLYVKRSDYIRFMVDVAHRRGFSYALPRNVKVVLQIEETVHGDELAFLKSKAAAEIGKSLRIRPNQVWVGQHLSVIPTAWLLNGEIIYVGPPGLERRFAERISLDNGSVNALFRMLVGTYAAVSRSA